MPHREKDKPFISPWADMYKTDKTIRFYHRLRGHWGEVIFSWIPLLLLMYLLLIN